MKRVLCSDMYPTLESLVYEDFINILKNSIYSRYINLSDIKLSNVREASYSEFTLDKINSLVETNSLPNEQIEEALVIEFTATYVPTGVSLDLKSEWMIIYGELVPVSSEMSDNDEFAYWAISEFTGEDIPDAYYDDEDY